MASEPSIRPGSVVVAGRPVDGRVIWTAGFCCALAVTVWSHEEQWQLDPVLAVAYSLIGLGWFGTAWLLWRQPEQSLNARLFLVLSVIWIVGEVARKDIRGLYEVTLFVAQYPNILCSALLLRYPRTRFDRAGALYVSSGFACATLFAVPLVLLAPGPGRPGDAPGRILDSLGALRFGDVQFGRSIVWAGYCVAFLVLFLRRWFRLTRFERATLRPILVSALVAAIAVGSAAVEPALPSALSGTLTLTRGLAGVLVSAAFLASAWRLRMARASVADLVERLSGPVTEQSVQEALVTVFDDPTIEVVAWGPGAQEEHEATGRLALPIPGSSGRPLALALFPPDFRRHTTLLRSHLAACGLALEAQEAQSRLVQAGLEERRRLEHDLHDGAQQGLLALGMGLGALEAKVESPDTAEAIRLLRKQLRQVQQELRDLAHGIYPTVLTQAGLGPALESVVERMTTPTALSVPPCRWNQDVENALYFVACEAIANAAKHAGPCRLRIDVREVAGGLELDVEDDGQGFDVEQSGRDPDRPLLGTAHIRLAALRGTLAVVSAPGRGTTIRATVPLPARGSSR